MSISCPPSYKRKIYDYNNANSDLIRADLLKLNWNDLFHNLNAHEKGLIFLIHL